MRKTPIIIDCDPGTDDIAALLLARNIERFDVKAVTTVAGNVALHHTTRNALQLLSFMGWDIPVARGADRPLVQPLVTAEDIHGKGGMLGLTLPETDKQADEKPAWDMLYEIAHANQGELEVIAMGPLTNIALALIKYPELKDWIRRIVIMGGAFLAGNITPAAEFNIYVDPDAAKRVFASGIPFHLCPLDVTHQGFITEQELDRIEGFGSDEARFFANIVRRGLAVGRLYTEGRGVALHDPLALLYAADDSYYTCEVCFIGVETRGSITRGKTVTDCYSDSQLENNGFLVQTVERNSFVEHIYALLRPYNQR